MASQAGQTNHIQQNELTSLKEELKIIVDAIKEIKQLFAENPQLLNAVYELHFIEDDFITEARGFDMKTGRVLTAPLSVKRLKKDAFPSVFKGYPEYCCKISRNH
ncbi:unnamed protein product [Larinioides sclopetarius]|uniref:Uncharacterized protein n=1 Tax=Larinioides sclopetarius TaxID=280406 RepID=A0AAV2BVN9_9ARAC